MRPRCELDKNLVSFNNTKTENVFIFVPIYRLVSIQPVQPPTKSRSKRLHFRAEVILTLIGPTDAKRISMRLRNSSRPKKSGKCQKLRLLSRGKLIIATSCDGDIAAPVDGCDNCTLHCLWRASARYTITPTYFYLHPNQF